MAQDYTIPHGKPGIASFESESLGNKGEPRFGEGPAHTVVRTVTAAADLDLSIYSVVSLINGVLRLATVGTVSGAATGTVTFTSTGPSNDDTVVIGGVTYTFKTALSTGPTVANQVLIHATPTNQAANLAAAINAGAGEGTAYSVGTVLNPTVSATSSAGVVTLLARDPGDEGNAIVLTEDADNTAVSGSGVLSGGDDDADNKPYGILASPVVMTNGQSMDVALYVSGHWNMDALNWDATYVTDASKQAAFEGSLNPMILVSKPKYNSDGIPV
jgi:hypothetical protein